MLDPISNGTWMVEDCWAFDVGQVFNDTDPNPYSASQGQVSAFTVDFQIDELLFYVDII